MNHSGVDQGASKDSTAISSSKNTKRRLKKSVKSVVMSSSSKIPPQASYTSTFTSGSLYNLVTPDSSMNTPTQDNVLTKEEARAKLIAGANKVADAVKLTLGAAGANGILQSPLQPFHEITNDGVSIAQSIHLTDPYENMGANLMKEIASRADKESADGTTTAVTVAQAIINEGSKVEAPPMEIMRSLNELLPLIEKSINEQKREITVDEIGKVGTISGESEELGRLLQEIYQKVGKEGIVELDGSGLPSTFYEIIDGVRFRNMGYMGDYCLTEPGKAVYDNIKVLVSKEKVENEDQLVHIINGLIGKEIYQLVLLCEDIDLKLASRIALTHMNGKFKMLLLKPPTLFKDWYFEDFAKITGATPIDIKNGKTFKSVALTDLGTCQKIIVSKNETRILGYKEITDHIASIKGGVKDDENLNMRLAWLQTKAAILKIGANSETELSYKKKKAIDAISACHLALEDGVVVGGGIALANTARKLPDTVGGKILRTALLAPLNQIIFNAGKDGKDFEKGAMGGHMGFNAKTGEVVDMWEAKIIDPAKVVKNAIRIAISVASTTLTTQIVVKLPEKPI